MDEIDNILKKLNEMLAKIPAGEKANMTSSEKSEIVDDLLAELSDEQFKLLYDHKFETLDQMLAEFRGEESEESEKDEVDEEANEILKRELGDKWNPQWTYEKLRSDGGYGYTNTYLYKSANYEEFSSSAKIEVMLELAKLDLKKGTTIPESIFSCC